jgi:hypothetical protein
LFDRPKPTAGCSASGRGGGGGRRRRRRRRRRIRRRRRRRRRSRRIRRSKRRRRIIIIIIIIIDDPGHLTPRKGPGIHLIVGWVRIGRSVNPLITTGVRTPAPSARTLACSNYAVPATVFLCTKANIPSRPISVWVRLTSDTVVK